MVLAHKETKSIEQNREPKKGPPHPLPQPVCGNLIYDRDSVWDQWRKKNGVRTTDYP